MIYKDTHVDNRKNDKLNNDDLLVEATESHKAERMAIAALRDKNGTVRTFNAQ